MSLYLEHFGLDSAPFKITPHTEVFFEGARRGAILDALVYAVTEGEGLIKVTGEVGSGKTMLCRVLADRLPERVDTIYLAVPSLTRDEILQAIAHEMHLKKRDQSAPSLLRAIQDKLVDRHAKGHQVVVLIDEAHAMPLDSLEEIRLLSNLETNQAKLLQIVLFGQPELDLNLSEQHMRQLKERITHSFTLAPLADEDVREYLTFRLRAAGYRGPELFDGRCVDQIAKVSKGLTRRINILADKTLLAAFAENTHNITPAHVKAAILDSEFAAAAPAQKRHTQWITAGALACGVVLGAGLQAIGYWAKDRPADVYVKTSSEYTNNSILTNPTNASSEIAVPTEHRLAPARSIPSAARPQATPRVGPTPDRGNHAAGLERAWINDAPAEHWVIQLTLADLRDTTDFNTFFNAAREAVGEDKLHRYPLVVAGREKMGLVYGSFSDRSGALGALAQLPANLQLYKPYIRSVGAVRREASE